jgi:3-mercaptopyruvate sulfurtransferase SseA
VGQAYMRSWSKRIAWLCLLLTLIAAYSLAAHHHSNSVDAAKCTVCVAAHSASPLTTARLPNAVFVPLHSVSTAEPVSAKQRLISFALSVRPPPEV